MSEPWEALRDVEPPPGARGRVRRKLEAELDERARPRRRGRAWLLVAAGVVLGVAGSALWRHAPAPAPSVSAEAPRVAPPAEAARPRQIAAASGQRVELPLAHGHLSVRGPADVVVGEDSRIELRAGTVDTLGRVEVMGPSCSARVDGAAEVAVASSALLVRVFAGSAEVTPASSSCRVVQLAAPAVPAVPAAPAQAPAPMARAHAAASAAPSAPAPAPRSPLAEEVTAYQQALALERVDPIAALGSWRAAQRAWPDGALAHEVDLHVIQTLVRLGHAKEARVEARAFLARYPASPRAADVRALVDDEAAEPPAP